MGSPAPLGGRFWCLIAATFLGFLGFGTVLPALAPHVRHDLGGSDRTVGFVIGIFSVVALCSRLFAGRTTKLGDAPTLAPRQRIKGVPPWIPAITI